MIQAGPLGLLEARKAQLRKIHLFRGAGDAAIGALLREQSIKKYRKGEHLFMEGDRVEHFCFIMEGAAYLYKLDAAGGKRGIFVMGPGEAVNCEIIDRKPASTSCAALEEVKALTVKRDVLLDLCARDGALFDALTGALALELRRLCRIVRNANTRLDRRIASRLWKFARDFGRPRASPPGAVEIGFDLSVTFLAELLGAQRESVSRELKKMKSSGLLAVDRGRFVVASREGLERYCQRGL